MQNNNNMNLLGFKDVVFDSFYEDNDFIHVHASVKKMDTCPHCGSKRIWVHDHRVQKIKDTHIRGKKSLIHLKKTRYDCKSCGCRFERYLDFIAKVHTMTNRLVFAIVYEFDEICNSFKYPWYNGHLEDTHTKIKTLKRNCIGMKNFNLFRKRIMFACK